MEFSNNLLELDKIYYEDCIQGMAERIPDESIDLVIADPPFGINFDKMGSQYNRKASLVIPGYSEIKQDYEEFSHGWIKEVYRVLKNTGSFYLISGWTKLREILNAIAKAGFITVNHIIWKYQFGVFTKRKFVSSHYHVLFLVKNPKKYYFNKIDHYPEDVMNLSSQNVGSPVSAMDEYWLNYMENVWEIKRPYNRGKIKNSTKLPEELVEKFIKYSSRPMENGKKAVVLDPFMGNGTTAVACVKNRRNFIGFEINPACKPTIDQNIAEARVMIRDLRDESREKNRQRDIISFMEKGSKQ
ncbi:MAG: DNA-methyltransferase [Candidatus Helarchaeota archaeon]